MGVRRWTGILSLFLKENFLSLAFSVVILLVLIQGFGTTQEGASQEELRIVGESITRAVISCYAIEGVYPESFDYLKENYALHIDEEKYYVQYSIFASNIMPDITIIEVSP